MGDSLPRCPIQCLFGIKYQIVITLGKIRRVGWTIVDTKVEIRSASYKWGMARRCVSCQQHVAELLRR